MRELEVLREKRMSQEKLLESVSKQRDTLAELLKQQKSPVKVADPGTASRVRTHNKFFYEKKLYFSSNILPYHAVDYS